ncbi:hypothetical protein SAMN06265367_1013 [Algoriphagus winogradskyi]|uniref:Sulfatase-modifying factor enzyme 1 n=1 Tax=Algoriphagus winogradskyi TaxID=237017 RepID=A0ABY1N6W4_9BACT|nr:hypothetical protein SAMN06265367_1013 [Algoriphagus winogradskyi]
MEGGVWNSGSPKKYEAIINRRYTFFKKNEF